jgi:cytochrome c-type biogenesis protein
LDSSIFFGGSVIAATIAGVIALFAPCCISVMLPAYFASSFQNRRLLVAMTFLFSAGIATVILPLAMGASALRQLFTEEHTTIYVAGGLIMVGLGVYTLLGGQLHIPVPGRRAGGKGGPLSIYSLGVFSGVASSCCTPVLAGVIALSGIASSFGLALGLGAAYVFGMVAPLFIISLLWESYDWRASRLFRPRTFTYRLGPFRRTITGAGLASGLLLTLMGAATLYVGLAVDAMPASGGWQADLSVRLQGYGQALTEALSWIPGWVGAIVLLIVVALLAWRALRQVTPDPDGGKESESREDVLERRRA